MLKSNFKVLKKIVTTPCYSCNDGLRGSARPRKECKECGGTGKYKENHYYFINGKYAYDGETIK